VTERLGVRPALRWLVRTVALGALLGVVLFVLYVLIAAVGA
jgi:hypothetical protein